MSIIDKYKPYINKVNRSVSQKRNLFKKWTLEKVRLVGQRMKPLDRYNYLVECGFIINSHIKCKKRGCQGERKDIKMSKNSLRTDGVQWKCRGTRVVKGVSSTCNGYISARNNTWFSGSKLRMNEILQLTYCWWSKIYFYLVY